MDLGQIGLFLSIPVILTVLGALVMWKLHFDWGKSLIGIILLALFWVLWARVLWPKVIIRNFFAGALDAKTEWDSGVAKLQAAGGADDYIINPMALADGKFLGSGQPDALPTGGPDSGGGDYDGQTDPGGAATPTEEWPKRVYVPNPRALVEIVKTWNLRPGNWPGETLVVGPGSIPQGVRVTITCKDCGAAKAGENWIVKLEDTEGKFTSVTVGSDESGYPNGFFTRDSRGFGAPTGGIVVQGTLPRESCRVCWLEKTVYPTPTPTLPPTPTPDPAAATATPTPPPPPPAPQVAVPFTSKPHNVEGQNGKFCGEWKWPDGTLAGLIPCSNAAPDLSSPPTR